MEEKYCNRYEMDCDEVEDECIVWVGGLGFKGWDCDLNCDKCKDMEII